MILWIIILGISIFLGLIILTIVLEYILPADPLEHMFEPSGDWGWVGIIGVIIGPLLICLGVLI